MKKVYPDMGGLFNLERECQFGSDLLVKHHNNFRVNYSLILSLLKSEIWKTPMNGPIIRQNQ